VNHSATFEWRPPELRRNRLRDLPASGLRAQGSGFVGRLTTCMSDWLVRRRVTCMSTSNVNPQRYTFKQDAERPFDGASGELPVLESQPPHNIVNLFFASTN